jgi:protein-disulfide isomerase-like protein with CxxC motif
MRIAFAAEQTRILTTNILNRFLKHQGVPDATFNNLVDKSNEMAKRNIIARSPEMKSLMQEWFAAEPEDRANHEQKPDRKEPIPN